MDKKILDLLKTLPPITACVVWDVISDRVTLQTIELADHATDQEWESYDIVRCIAAANPAYPPKTEAKALVDMMLAEFDVEQL
jgi:hypothetical protein